MTLLNWFGVSKRSYVMKVDQRRSHKTETNKGYNKGLWSESKSSRDSRRHCPDCTSTNQLVVQQLFCRAHDCSLQGHVLSQLSASEYLRGMKAQVDAISCSSRCDTRDEL
jgi:hypothetical protein